MGERPKADIVEIIAGFINIMDRAYWNNVSLNFVPEQHLMHGVIFFLNGCMNPSTVCYQNDYIDVMEASHEKYDTYPKYVVPELQQLHMLLQLLIMNRLLQKHHMKGWPKLLDNNN